MAELRGLGALHQTLKSAGGSVLAISVDPLDQSAKAARQHKIPFPLLSDPDLTAITAYGLIHENAKGDQDLAKPANFLIDTDGAIVWSWIAQRIQDRADPAEIERQVHQLLDSK
jgi:peroxiredoxin